MLSQKVVIQVLQKLCPHGVEMGLLNTFKQMEQEKSSSDQEVAKTMPRKQLFYEIKYRANMCNMLRSEITIFNPF